MVEDVKPSWYFQRQQGDGYFRFYIGKVASKENGIKHWVLNIGLYFWDFGYAY